MEYIVFSDSHGNYTPAIEVLSKSGHVEMIFHLGDGAEDVSMIEHICLTKIMKVAGNCDPPGKYPREISTVINKKRILMTHGDRYNVKSGLSKLLERAVATNSDVVLYGHTHCAAIDRISGILFVNPGSLQRGSARKSYARLSINEDGAEAVIIFLEE